MKHILLSLALLACAACGPELPGDVSSENPSLDTVETHEAPVVTPPAGSIPAGLPARLMVGLFEDTGQTWMKDSAVPWDVRYRYFTKGWVNNWGWSASDGSWGKQFMTESALQGFIPAIQYYQVNEEPGGGEAQFLAKAQNATTMKSYFSDFKVLMQRAKEFGKPVLVLMEADGYGYLQQHSNNNPGAYAAVAATGLPELAGLPNTVAGWGLAFLQLRKAVGANNVTLGMHISGWASGKDIAHFSVTDPLQPEVDKVYNFLKPLGLGPNVTGATYDVLVGDPLDRDADFYAHTFSQDRWWDASDSASISSKSFNRYAEWLRLWNVTSGKRWVLWQLPEGNSDSLNVDNTSNAPRAGYKDNRTEYFFGTGGATHREKFASSGVIALLFGRGEGQQASHTNDHDKNGQLFLKTYAGAFLKAGGLAIPAGSTTTPTPTPTPTPGPDTATYSFESGTQGWTFSGALVKGVTASTAKAYAGSRSLAVTMGGTAAGMSRVSVLNAAVPAGRTVSFRVWIPAGSRITGLQPYVQQGSTGGWLWTGAWVAPTSLKAGDWSTVTVKLPTNAVSPLHQLGLELFTDAAWSGTVYVDSVSW
ncbi:hypothetical protein [Archangium lansingense]|uniref:Mannanase galactose-binding domain-containing protein n=1 Tax=Archangium lansingense TaxID=2995310 RepID=A0ABT4AN43_9BACT|nr:hypothetical protein [Archangium lansinium]MCY1082269.1 hypothetical protein [Archangium lansinium]